MRQKALVHSRFWDWSKEHELLDREKLIAIYLLTCSDGNMSGIFNSPIPPVAFRLAMGQEGVEEVFSRLSEIGFLRYCHKTGWIILPKATKWNSLKGSKHEASTMTTLEAVPKSSVLYEVVKPAIDGGLDTLLDTLSDTLSDGVSDRLEIKDIRLKSIDKPPYTPQGESAEVIESTPPKKPKHHVDAKAVGLAYREILVPPLPDFSDEAIPTKEIRARAKQYKSLREVRGWKGLFVGIRDKCPYLVGEVNDGWRANLSWIVKQANMAKIMNKQYVRTDGTSKMQAMVEMFEEEARNATE